MKKFFILMATAAILILAGCSITDNTDNTNGLPDSDIVIPPFDANVVTNPSDSRPLNPPNTGVYPAVINIGNFHAGARADDYPDGSPLAVSIYNASDSTQVFTVYCQIPTIGRTRDGYTPAPYNVHTWLGYNDSVVIPPCSWADVPFALVIPDTATYIPAQWEFWMVACQSGTGSVEYANAIRVLVDMKE